MQTDKFALDRSMRSKDADGHMRVEVSHISKAAVNPYYGREIPNSAALGLRADDVYQLLRDPTELERAAPTFAGKPILIKHKPVHANDPQKDLVVGSIGTDVAFNFPYLDASLMFTDAEAIAVIESRQQQELSCGYRYTADMTPGEFEGVKYDGVMRDIQGNHVALVEDGRAGSDVVVQDSNPFKPEAKPMKRKQGLIAAKALMRQSLTGVVTPEKKASINAAIIALDAEIEQVEDEDMTDEERAKAEKDADKKAADEDEAEQKAKDEDDEEEAKKKAAAEKAAKDKAKDEEQEDKPTKAAMDAAIKAAATKAEQDTVARMNAIRSAEKDVAPLVGDVAGMDGAEAVYKFALDQNQVETKGVHPSAYGSMVALLKSQKATTQTQLIAQDSAADAAFDKMFPNAVTPKKGV